MISELLFSAGLLLLLCGAAIPLAAFSRDMMGIRPAALACTIVASAALGCAAILVLITGQGFTLPVPWLVPYLGIAFTLDRLSAFFLSIIALVAACVAIYSLEYVEHLDGGSRRSLLCAAMNIFILAMVLVVASSTTLSFLFFWELMAAASFILVMYEYREPETKKAGIFYFVMTQLSTLFVMLGIISLYAATGSFAFVPAGAAPSLPVTIAFLALFTGFAIKAGIIPFHKWLPYAHPASPTPVSALMSGVMLKIAVYGFLRFLLDVFAPEVWWGVLILAAGTASATLGVIYALKEHDLKAMLAYSSIENIGIIFIGIGLYVLFAASGLPALATLSLLGALFHSLNHALIKSLLFLTGGSVVRETRTRDIELMGGLSAKMPATSALFFVGAAALSALPPLNGFASEYLIFVSFFSSIASIGPLFKVLLFICLALFALTSALSAACFVKAFGSVFLAMPRSAASAGAREVPLPMLAGPTILAAACVLLGLFSFQLFTAAGYLLPLPDMLLVGALLLCMTALVWAVLHWTACRTVRISGTWGCGTLSQAPSTEYTGHGFSEPVDIIFSMIYRTRIRNERTFSDRYNCIFESGTAEIRLLKVFEEYLYLPVARASTRAAAKIARFQNGCLDTYLLYVFVTVIAVILFLGWFA